MTISTSIPQEQEQRKVLEQFIVHRLRGENLELPLLPVVANQVLMLSNDPQADPKKLTQLIQQDQALAGKILFVANSPAYLPRSPIVSLQQAIAWLGLNMLSCLAISISMQNGVFKTRGYDKEVRHMWHHALATSLFGKEIARRMRQNVENAFLCGLLHAIGKPLILHLLQTSPRPIQQQPGWTILDSLIDTWHIPAGVKLAEAWNLPEPVLEAIRLYPDQTCHLGASPAKGAPITCLADHLASWLLDPASHDEDTLRTLPVVKILNFYPNDMTALFAERDTIQRQVDAFLV